ncbi:histidine phosphatase family protein [uncultured Tateyamaria sp.]|uniref:histidine phosphatase family protein n=1 Tax=uncultured Tateyamaria sp. TaxID=455651 RepID=UPI002608E5FE|nr:histidine phosphatase family protein [uncultured Tateyamaria sp.]
MTRAHHLYYLSHPQVRIDPAVPVPDWGLNEIGAARVAALADAIAHSALAGVTSVFTSPERKARETAAPLAQALDCACTVIENSHENDRSATGYLPGPTFEAMADAFFGQPDVSTRGWERAVDAQARITACMHEALNTAPQGDVLMVGHGAVGTLLYCHLAGQKISRRHDQGPGGGGNVIRFDRKTLIPEGGWAAMESLLHA